MVWVRLVRFACCCCGQICVVLVLTCWSYWRFIIAPASARSGLPAPVATGPGDVVKRSGPSIQYNPYIGSDDGIVALRSNPMLSAAVKSQAAVSAKCQEPIVVPGSTVELVPLGSSVVAQLDDVGPPSRQLPVGSPESLFRAASKSNHGPAKESRPVVRRMSTRNLELAEQLTHRLGVTPSIARSTATAFGRGGVTSRHTGPARGSSSKSSR